MSMLCHVCGGRLMAELVESFFERGRFGETELICVWCGRSPGDAPVLASRPLCREPGCLKERAGAGDLCAGHQSAATRNARKVGV